jgi:hypothetical protein
VRATVTLHITRFAGQGLGLISDITKMGEYSPDVIEAE